MVHNEYWEQVQENAHNRLHHLFSDCQTKLHDVVGDENGIDSFHDAKKVLTFIFRHQPTCEEKACAILSVTEALQATHELSEHTAMEPKVGVHPFAK